MVLDAGQLAEFDTPKNLLTKEGGTVHCLLLGTEKSGRAGELCTLKECIGAMINAVCRDYDRKLVEEEEDEMLMEDKEWDGVEVGVEVEEGGL